MPHAVNASIQDTLIGNQIDLIKLEGSVRAEVLKVLQELEGDILKRLNAIDPTAPSLTKFQQLRLKKLLDQVQKITGSSFASARRITDKTLLQLAALESGLAAGAFDIALGTSLAIPTLNRQVLQELVKDGLIMGAPSREWWAKQASGLTDAFRTQMRLGVLGNESIGQLTTRVRGIMNVTRRQAEALARTSVQSVANLARLRTYQENAAILNGIQWVSTLDSRTTDICKGLDGLIWDTDLNPIGHSTSFPGPTAHWQCRSTQTPITKSFEELATDKSAQAKAFAKKADQAGSGARSALDGTVPATLNYEGWLLLKEKAEPGFALNSGALTASKYALWKQGKLDFKQLIDQSANPITVKELQQRLKDIIPSTALPAAALQAQQTVVGASGSFASKTSQAAAEAKTAQEVMAARVEQAKQTAAINAKKDAQETFQAYTNKATAPTTYHFNALKDLTKQKGGKYIDDLRKNDPVKLVAMIDNKATKKKLSVDLAHYKQSVIKGKKPSAAAQAAFETLPDEAAKDVLDAIKVKQAANAAEEAAKAQAAAKAAQVAAANEAAAAEIATIIANPKGQTKLAKALQDGLKDPDLKGLSPARQLAAAKDKAAAVQAQAEKSAVLSGYKKKLLSKEKPTPKQSQVAAGLTAEEGLAVQAQIEALEEALEGYKNAIAGGIAPTKAQTKAANFLTPKGKKALAAELQTLKAKAPPTAPEVKVAAKKLADTDKSPELDMAGWKRKRDKPGGSVPGAVYEDETGTEWIVKFVSSDDASRNEVLTAKLYNLVGVNTPDIRLVRLSKAAGSREGGIGVASRFVDGLEDAKSAAKQKALDGTYDGYAADAWLANWDVAGLNFDNIVKGPTGKALRIDVGGGLRYRAQGGAKGANWTKTVDEIDSLRDAGINRQTAATFKAIPEAKIEAGVAQILRVTDEQITDLVEAFGPTVKRERTSLIATLKARRNDLKKRYPHLLKSKPAPAVRRTGDVVADAEFKRIQNANATGYSVRADIDEIEDQQILIHQEKVRGKPTQTVATMKLRGEGLKKMNKQVQANASVVEGLDTADLDNKLLTAIKGVAYRTGQGNPLEAKDLQRIKVAIGAADNTRERLQRLITKGVYGSDQLDRFDSHYAKWLNELENAAEINAWNPPVAAGGVFKPIRMPKPKKIGVDKERLAWSRGEFKFGSGTFQNGQVTKSAPLKPNLSGLQGESRPWVATMDDGTELRYWADDAPPALRGRLEVTTRGDDVIAANRAAGIPDEVAQINTSLPTALDEEELYLIQIAFSSYPKSFNTFVKQISAGKTQADRIAKAKAFLNKKAGKDITLLPDYNPAGLREAGEVGRIFRFRADLLADPDWRSFANQYRVHHNLYQKVPDAVEQIVASGGRLTPTVEKLRLGIVTKGMSPTSDMNSGGADYFFTRIKSKTTAYRYTGLVWKPRVLGRTDAISYAGDKYGRTSTPEFIIRNRHSSIAELRKAARNSSNETIFKNGLSLFEDLEHIVVANGKDKADLIRRLKSNHGLLRWPDGRDLDDVIRVAGRDR